MITYECRTCQKVVEIEVIEAAFGNNEPYESDQCKECFDTDVEEGGNRNERL